MNIKRIKQSLKELEEKEKNPTPGVKLEDTNLVGIGSIMLTTIDVDYDNPDLEKCKELVFNDFSSKILTLFRESPFSLRKHSPHCFIYSQINKRWLDYCQLRRSEFKQIAHYSDIHDGLSSHIHNYILDYMEHSYIGKNVNPPTEDDIINWCGGGEFPFLEVFLIKKDDEVWICYYIVR